MASIENVDKVLRETRSQDAKFRAFHYEKTKIDNFRTLVSQSLGPIEKVGSMVVSAASASFPSTVTFTVVIYLIYLAETELS